MIEVLGDPLARRLSVSGETVTLTERELELFQVLASRPGEFIAKQELEAAIWGTSEYLCFNTLGSLVHRLRQKVGPEHVINSHKFGYMYKPVLE